MKLKKLSVVLAAALLASVVLSGCAGGELMRPKQADIDAYLAANPNLPAIDQACIDDGRFEMGMLASTVRFLLGEPKAIEHDKKPWGKTQEIWIYKRGNRYGFAIEDGHVVEIDPPRKK